MAVAERRGRFTQPGHANNPGPGRRPPRAAGHKERARWRARPPRAPLRPPKSPEARGRARAARAGGAARAGPGWGAL